MKNLQKVRIVLRDGFDIDVKEVTIDFEGRKNLRGENFYEDGRWYNCSRWEREDGKVDSYKAVELEAQTNGLN